MIIEIPKFARYCLSMQAADWMVALNLLGHILVGLAYIVIPLQLWAFTRKRPDLLYGKAYLWRLFVVFIAGCGLSHLMVFVRTAVAPWYALDTFIIVVVALVSVFTAGVMPLAMRSMASIPSSERLQREIDVLKSQISSFEERFNREADDAHRERMAIITQLADTRENIERTLESVSTVMKEARSRGPN